MLEVEKAGEALRRAELLQPFECHGADLLLPGGGGGAGVKWLPHSAWAFQGKQQGSIRSC